MVAGSGRIIDRGVDKNITVTGSCRGSDSNILSAECINQRCRADTSSSLRARATGNSEILRVNQPGTAFAVIAAGIDGNVIQSGNDFPGRFNKSAVAIDAAPACQQCGAAYVKFTCIGENDGASVGRILNWVRGDDDGAADVNRGCAFDGDHAATREDIAVAGNRSVALGGAQRAITHERLRIDMASRSD